MQATDRPLDLQIVTGRFPALSELFVYRPVVALARLGHHVRVLSRQDGDWERFPDPLPSNLEVEILPPDIDLRSPDRAALMFWRSLRSAARASSAAIELYDRCKRDPLTREDPLRNFVRHLPFLGRTKPDVIHFEFLGTGAMYPLVPSLTKVPTVVSCRGSDIHLFELRERTLQASMLASLRSAAAIHCVSQEIADKVTRLVGARPGIWINRPAVDVTHIEPRTWVHRSTGPLRIVSVGRMSWHKAFDYLLAALARLKSCGIDFEATLIGDGELLPALRFTVADLGLEGKVRLPGAVSPDRVFSHLQASDVFVLASHNEGVSNAALEAMACALPVISTRVGGMPEAIDEGVEGLLVPPRDVEALANAIQTLANDRGRCATMGMASRSRIERDFSLERQVTTFEQMYRAAALEQS